MLDFASINLFIRLCATHSTAHSAQKHMLSLLSFNHFLSVAQRGREIVLPNFCVLLCLPLTKSRFIFYNSSLVRACVCVLLCLFICFFSSSHFEFKISVEISLAINVHRLWIHNFKNISNKSLGYKPRYICIHLMTQIKEKIHTFHRSSRFCCFCFCCCRFCCC